MLKIKLFISFLILLLCYGSCKAQDESTNIESGYFSVARRSSISMWGLNEWKPSGLGTGTAFRIQISKRLNSEWYGDFIKTEYKGLAYRFDRHLTNSLMYYLREPEADQVFRPFVSASVFCLDFTRLQIVGEEEAMQRFSLSQQLGIGSHFFITERFDFSIYAQYYNHLGRDIHVHEHSDGTIEMEEVRGRISLEGHMFLVCSFGYRFIDLWGKKEQ